MTKVVLDEALRAKLDLSEAILELCDEEGHTVGFIRPFRPPNPNLPFRKKSWNGVGNSAPEGVWSNVIGKYGRKVGMLTWSPGGTDDSSPGVHSWVCAVENGF